MKPANLNSSTCVDFGAESNDKDPIFKVNDHVKTSKYKFFFLKDHTPNWSEKAFGIKKSQKHCAVDVSNRAF